MDELKALLEIQRLDNVLDQLHYRREHLPERATLVELALKEAEADAASADAEGQRNELRRRQRQLEDDATDLEAKATDLESKLYGGAITSPKEATAVSDEIKSLKARQSELEEQSIELLVEIDPLDEALVEVEAARGELEARRAQTMATLQAAETEIDAELQVTTAQREAAAEAISADRLEQYRKLRITYGPRAIVEFDAGKDGGCPVAMSAVELDRWKHLPAGTLDTCVDCGRLVAKLT